MELFLSSFARYTRSLAWLFLGYGVITCRTGDIVRPVVT